MESEEPHTAPPDSNAFDLLAADNVAAAVAAITAMGDTQAALEAFAQLCQRAYRDLKSVPTMTAVAWEAVGFGLKCAAESPDPNAPAGITARQNDCLQRRGELLAGLGRCG